MDTNAGVRSKGERFSQVDVANAELTRGHAHSRVSTPSGQSTQETRTVFYIVLPISTQESTVNNKVMLSWSRILAKLNL